MTKLTDPPLEGVTMTSSVVRVPSHVSLESKRIAALRGQASSEVLATAWAEYMENHRDEFAADLETAAKLIRDGTAEDLAQFASRNVKDRAAAAARRARDNSAP